MHGILHQEENVVLSFKITIVGSSRLSRRAIETAVCFRKLPFASKHDYAVA